MFELCLGSVLGYLDNAGTSESARLEYNRHLTPFRPDEGNLEVCLFGLSLLLIYLRCLHNTRKGKFCIDVKTAYSDRVNSTTLLLLLFRI